MRNFLPSILIVSVMLVSGCGTRIPSPGLGDIDIASFMEEPRDAEEPEREDLSHADRVRRSVALQMSQALFSYKFSVGGVWPWQREFEPGQWTKWEFCDASEIPDLETELAFLKEAEEEISWWRLSLDPPDDDAIIYEALIAEPDFSVRRLRAKMGPEEPFEVPVTEGTYGYAAPLRITPESLEAASVGEVDINVPAGSFTARHIRYGIPERGEIELWLSETVPGGVIRYRYTSPEKEVFTASLTDYGRDAETLLESY